MLNLILGFSCTNIPTKDSDSYQDDTYMYIDNDLVQPYIRIYEEVNIKTQVDEQWIQGVDTNLLYNIEQKVLASKIKKYDAAIFLDDNTDTSIVIAEQDIEKRKEELNCNLSALYFTENWKFSKKNYQLEKEILMWTPVYFCQKEYKDTVVNIKKVIYDIHNKKLSNEKLIASDITYEFSLIDDKERHNTLNAKRIVDLILTPVLEGKQKAYNFDTDQKYSLEEIEERLGKKTDSIEVENTKTGEIKLEVLTEDASFEDINALIFVEDWYMDMDNLSIRKHVKSVAPVKFIYDVDGNMRKRILFKVNLRK